VTKSQSAVSSGSRSARAPPDTVGDYRLKV
jgi:hypothetical protein